MLYAEGSRVIYKVNTAALMDYANISARLIFDSNMKNIKNEGNFTFCVW